MIVVEHNNNNCRAHVLW